MNNRNEIKKLQSKSPTVRDSAAVALMKSKPRNAKMALLKAALNKNNIGYSGTLIYALNNFYCGNIFSQLFDLAIFGNFEVKCIALGILDDQTFDLSDIEILAAEYKLESLKSESFIIEDKSKFIHSLARIIRKAKKNPKKDKYSRLGA